MTGKHGSVQEVTTTTTATTTIEDHCENQCFTVVNGETIINPCCDELHTIQVGHDWVDVTPSSRHGEVLERCLHDKDESVQCLVVRPDLETGRDTANLEYCNLSVLPDSDQSHELYSVCISKDVRQCLILDIDDESRWEKVIYFADRTDWTEPQVMAVVLLMHAVLASNALSIVTMNKEVEAAELMAEKYCRSMGVNRTELSALHTTGSPTRISRVDVERIKRKEPDNSLHAAARDIEVIMIRRDSQSPVKPSTDVVIIESGGVDHSHILDRDFNIKPLSDKLVTKDFHCDDRHCDEKSLKKSKKSKSKKAKKEKKKAKKDQKEVDLITGELIDGIEDAIDHSLPAEDAIIEADVAQTAEERVRRYISVPLVA